MSWLTESSRKCSRDEKWEKHVFALLTLAKSWIIKSSERHVCERCFFAYNELLRSSWEFFFNSSALESTIKCSEAMDSCRWPSPTRFLLQLGRLSSLLHHQQLISRETDHEHCFRGNNLSIGGVNYASRVPARKWKCRLSCVISFTAEKCWLSRQAFDLREL